MSKERARRRAVREEVAAQRREQRERAALRRERRAARTSAVRAKVPRAPRLGHGRPQGLLATRHRRRVLVMSVLWVLIQVVAGLLVESWAGRGVVAVLTAFAMPVIWTLVYDRT